MITVETDVLNTYCVYLRFETMRGKLTEENYLEAIQQLRQMLEADKKPHLTEFLEKMP